jgi:hypothetical protein
MTVEDNAVRKARKLRVSRDQWKLRSAEKQQQIRQLRVTVRDMSSSRDHWKQRAADLEQQLKVLQAVHEAPSAAGSGLCAFLGGLMTQTVQSPRD